MQMDFRQVDEHLEANVANPDPRILRMLGLTPSPESLQRRAEHEELYGSGVIIAIFRNDFEIVSKQTHPPPECGDAGSPSGQVW